mmetsp:Transcript_10189/g.21249  ORF Transcript_10189/g.21249 Transcript_10189/m.21249 type:complete len:426 (-) Transcript_10189:404-1681(-)|eukprot:CAMPEP_0118933570 /NCGR_PEP_ID=MMETSP1169-20130426/12064_1 /TAXON_ID=36882 /ORGANISM="Pyramimonas obovata, Strain CCMP722" /LENGTH=425 /DNA_ID=CAMNT_0006876351 /DNA_START=135 /DNA_END=1412 /DNA_ORIENTATION=+
MTVEMDELRTTRFVCVCPPKELHDGARRGRTEEIRAQLANMGFDGDARLFLGDGGGLAVSSGSELFDDGKVVVAFCGELTNKEALLQKLLPDDDQAVADQMKEDNVAAKLIGKLYEQLGEHPQGLVGKLRGTYTFIIFDIEQVRMFAARDYSGPTPLYQSRLADGTTVLSNYMTQECDADSEVPVGHYVYGARRCSFPQKFSQSKDELDKARVDAKQAVSKALQGILTRSELQPRLHQSIQARQRKSQERHRSPEKKPSAPFGPSSPPVVTVLSQTIHTPAPRRKQNKQHTNSAWRSDTSRWWRKAQPAPLSAAAAPFVMPASEEAPPAAPEAAPVLASDAAEVMVEANKELIIEAVNQLHRIASSGKLQCLMKVQEQELASAPSGLRRTPSCGEMDKLSSLQRVPSHTHVADLSSLSWANNEAH